MTLDYTANYRSTFSDIGATPSDPSYVGDLIGDASGTFTTLTISLSINRTSEGHSEIELLGNVLVRRIAEDARGIAIFLIGGMWIIVALFYEEN